MKKKNIFITISLLIILMGLPLFVFISSKTTNPHSHANAATTLYLTPSSSANAPLQYNTGETVSFGVYINPGTNLVSYTKLELQYDPTKFQPSGTSPFSPNSAVFPTILSGPVNNSGDFLIALSVGSNPTSAIATVEQIGTFTLTAIAPTTTSPTVVSFGPNTEVLSIASSDQSNENVLSTTIPAYVSLLAPTPTPGPVLLSPTQSAAVTPLPTVIPTPKPSVTPAPPTTAPQAATPTISQNGTTLLFTVYLPDIGQFGDSADPTNYSDSNQNPLHPQRSVDAFILNAANTIIASESGTIDYNGANGNFTGAITFPNLSANDYRVEIQSPAYLRRLITGIQVLGPDQLYTMPPVYMAGGDFNGDNLINILDYNLLMGCYSDLLPASSCTPQMKALTDLYDAGQVNSVDYNLFLREISVQSGD